LRNLIHAQQKRRSSVWGWKGGYLQYMVGNFLDRFVGAVGILEGGGGAEVAENIC
jgi:hypothetical protein